MVWNGRITTWWGPQLPQSAMEENRLSVMTGWVLDFSDSTFRGIKIAKSISLILWMVHTAKILTKCRCKWVTVSHDFRVNCLTLLPCAIKTALLGSKSKSNIFSIMQIVQRSKLGKMSWYDLVCIEICDASPDRRWQFLSLWERSFVLLCIVYALMCNKRFKILALAETEADYLVTGRSWAHKGVDSLLEDPEVAHYLLNARRFSLPCQSYTSKCHRCGLLPPTKLEGNQQLAISF